MVLGIYIGNIFIDLIGVNILMYVGLMFVVVIIRNVIDFIGWDIVDLKMSE